MRTKAQRGRQRFARNFGEEASAVRELPCVVTGELGAVAAHVVSRGAGGGRFDIVGLLPRLHQEQHDHGIVTFAARYGLDLRALADAVALAHEPPLGIRGLAARFGVKRSSGMAGQLMVKLPEPLAGYDLAALLGWVRRRMETEVIARCDLRLGKPSWPSYRPGDDWDGLEDDCRLALSFAVGGDLCGVFQGPDSDELDGGQHVTETLCEQAGWPS